MPLIERLLGDDRIDHPKIPVYYFAAAVGEWARGRTTRTQIIQTFGLRAEDEADLDALVAKVQGMSVEERFKYRTELLDVLALAEGGIAYTTPAQIRARLGI